MLETEKKIIKNIDQLIFNELKEKLKIMEDKSDVLDNNNMKEILKKVNEKKDIIFLLFQGSFSVNERNIEERMQKNKKELNLYDRTANNIILKRVETSIKEIESTAPLNCRIISVCLDRKMFIEKIMKENISLNYVKQYMKEEIEK